MNKKGQVAFESLLVLLVILTGAIAITGYYMQTHGDTLAITAAKTELLKQIGEKNENIYIESIRIEKNPATTLIIKTIPTKTSADFDLTAIEQKAKTASAYSSITIIFE
jgi:uncharacterized protein (UPF0333 family)